MGPPIERWCQVSVEMGPPIERRCQVSNPLIKRNPPKFINFRPAEEPMKGFSRPMPFLAQKFRSGKTLHTSWPSSHIMTFRMVQVPIPRGVVKRLSAGVTCNSAFTLSKESACPLFAMLQPIRDAEPMKGFSRPMPFLAQKFRSGKTLHTSWPSSHIMTFILHGPSFPRGVVKRLSVGVTCLTLHSPC